uniref:Uncharacterized protein n=1 Tax=Arundo donax TaxID=35708 RepID=A0A0A9A6T8_ARUDO
MVSLVSIQLTVKHTFQFMEVYSILFAQNHHIQATFKLQLCQLDSHFFIAMLLKFQIYLKNPFYVNLDEFLVLPSNHKLNLN